MTLAMIIIKEEKQIVQAEGKGNSRERDNKELWGQKKWKMGK